MNDETISAPRGLTPASEVMAAQLIDLNEEVKRLREIFKHVGKRGWCRACKAEIFFVYHIDTDRYAPYDADGTNHFITCPEAGRFRRKSNAG